MNRRNFLKTSSMAGVSLTTTAIPNYLSRKDDRKVKVGIMGLGERGRSLLGLLLKREDCTVVALNDIDNTVLRKASSMVAKAGQTAPKLFAEGEKDYLRMLEMEELDAVIIATPWTWHVPMATASMRAGKYVGMEVSGATSIQECWELVNAYEETNVPLMFLENVCYRRDIMAILNMVREGMFGELIHMEGGYQHDLRHVKFNDGVTAYGQGVNFNEEGFSESKWRTNHSVHRNGELYPTHGIGPVAQMIDINRGNRFTYLTSTASKSRGLHNYIVDHPAGGEDHPNAKVNFKLGDVVTTVLKTAKGESVLLSHDTNLPRPYSLGFRVQGEKGIWMAVNRSIYLEGISKDAHRWESAEPYLNKFDHPMWKQYESKAAGAGHGGMDFFVIHDFIESVKNKTEPPIDVYDAATFMAITPLSEASIATGSSPVGFPDFTKGRWMKR
ncbi:MAG: Gfo/Idh/MocA family protein [Saprospiraceae bacterium]